MEWITQPHKASDGRASPGARILPTHDFAFPTSVPWCPFVKTLFLSFWARNHAFEAPKQSIHLLSLEPLRNAKYWMCPGSAQAHRLFSDVKVRVIVWGDGSRGALTTRWWFGGAPGRLRTFPGVNVIWRRLRRSVAWGISGELHFAQVLGSKHL